MRIAILSYYQGLNSRGVERWVDDLQKHLSGIEVFSKDKIGKFRLWWDADVIIPTGGRLQVLWCRLLSWVNGRPIVVFGHSGPGADDKWNLLCGPDVFVVFSPEQGKWVEKFKLPWTKAVLIEHAVDLEIFKPGKKQKRSIVLCAAANQPNKRIDLVKRAVEKIPGAEFLAVGKGNETEVPFNQMPEIYQKAKVFCFVPQPWEAFGLVYLEALASGLPVVTIDDPLRRWIVGNAGMFVKNPEDSEKLAGAIKEALKINWGDKPRKQAEKYGWNKVVGKYNKLFDDLVK